MSGAADNPTARESVNDLASLLALNQGALKGLEQLLLDQVDAFEPEIRGFAAYCLGTSGKRLRPLLVFLSGWEGEGKVNPSLVKAAAIIEMVHMATLVHDDIMDDATVRRGRTTVFEKDGPSIAVLLGDALFAQAVVLSTQFPDTYVCRRVAEATRRVCSGEILQTLGGKGSPTDRARYERVIDLKTAELFSVSCELGATIGRLDCANVESAATFGRHLGVAYQVYDDLSDFAGDPEVIGKTLGTDWGSGKRTLPVFEFLDRTPGDATVGVLESLVSGNPGKLSEIAAQMHSLGVFDAVLDRIGTELHRARSALSVRFPAGSRRHLLALCDILENQARQIVHSRTDVSG